eukprot:TRINITY_DN5963_c0_g1_i9.p2 TRINITY_DN5963_c0_g1~~TRINITY_DN5963_c0_g1_i9.p2  ORF type:complete len:139 (-),score=43.56 TRINITY_DN5963_c0_g1_i9:114-530(-)
MQDKKKQKRSKGDQRRTKVENSLKDLEEWSKEERLVKKLKTGKISYKEFKKQMNELSDEDDDEDMSSKSSGDGDDNLSPSGSDSDGSDSGDEGEGEEGSKLGKRKRTKMGKTNINALELKNNKEAKFVFSKGKKGKKQ